MIVSGVLRARARLAWRSFAGPHFRRLSRRHGPAVLVLTLILGGFVLWTMLQLFGWLTDRGAGAAESGIVLGYVFAAAIGALLVFDLHETVAALVVDSDLELLRRAPLPAVSVMAIKVVDALPRSGLPLAILAFPAACAWAAAYRLPLWGWLLLPLLLCAMWVVALGFGIGLAIDLLRIAPARRVRDLLALLSTLVLSLLWVANAFLLPRVEDPTGAMAQELRRMLAHPPALLAWSPPHQAARALAALSAGRPLDAAWETLALLGFAALALGFAVWRSSAGLEQVQVRIANPIVHRPQVRRARPIPARPQPLSAAVVARDARLFARDWTVLGDVLTAAALWTVLPLIVATPVGGIPRITLVRAMLLALTVGLGYEIAARALPFERGGIAWIPLSPRSAWEWVGAKFTAVSALSLPLLVLACAAVGLALPIPRDQWIVTLCLVVPALALAQVLGLLTGAIFGDPRWTHPRATLTIGGRLVASLTLVAQAGMWLLVSELLRRAGDAIPPAVSLVAPVGIAGLLAIVPLLVLAGRIERMEWSG